MSRSKGDSSAVRPSKSSPSVAGSRRHSPLTPSTTAGSPASPTCTGSMGIALAFWRAMPSEVSRLSFFLRSASSMDRTATSAEYTRSGRSHSRSRHRAGTPEQLEDVAPEAVVVTQPGALLVVPRPLGRTGEVQAEVAHRPHHRVELEQRPVLL